MADAIADFFDALSRRGHEPMLCRLRATVRWDILDGDRTEHRTVRIDRGHIEVSSGDGPSDCVITAARSVCNDVVRGRTSPLLRGAVTVDGDPELMVLAQRLFPRQRGVAEGRSHPAEGGAPGG